MQTQNPHLSRKQKDASQVIRDGIGAEKRRNESEEEREARLAKMSGAVKTLLECIGEDPDREGLLKTPERYAKALMFLTKGYDESMNNIMNGAIFNEGKYHIYL
ncbi:GTP cyclohydrolase 1 [Coemansia sp. RSA 1935]|nr:GTP cyclohydrolase 1 [Coemansia sp. RSA 1935]